MLNRRQFLCGVAAAAIVPPAMASTAVDPDLVAACVEYQLRVQAEALTGWWLVGNGEKPALRHILWSQPNDPTDWTTDDLRYSVVMLPPKYGMSQCVPGFPLWSKGL